MRGIGFLRSGKGHCAGHGERNQDELQEQATHVRVLQSKAADWRGRHISAKRVGDKRPPVRNVTSDAKHLLLR